MTDDGRSAKTMMDAANFWLPIVGGLLLGGIAVGAWFADKKVAAWGFGIAGAFCFLILIALQVRQAFHVAEAPGPNSSAIAIRQARAYVHVLQIEITPVLNQNHDLVAWAFGVTFENTGNTPANQFRNWKHFDFFPKEKTPAKAEWSVSDDGPSITIPPHSRITTDSEEFPVERFTEVRKGTTIFLATGLAKYSDVFKGTARHQLEFSYDITLIDEPTNIAMGSPFRTLFYPRGKNY